jgi:hypothetical protein
MNFLIISGVQGLQPHGFMGSLGQPRLFFRDCCVRLAESYPDFGQAAREAPANPKRRGWDDSAGDTA